MPAGSQLGYRAEGIYRSLRGELVRGVYPPETRLPSLEKLAKRSGVTAVTMRKAALRLAAEGMLEIRHGSGIYVKRPEALSPVSKTISVMYMFDEKNINIIQRAILDRGFLMNIYSQTQHNWDIGSERFFLRRVLEDRHQALIAFCSPIKPGNQDLLREIAYAGTRVIHVEHSSVEVPEQSYILPDFRRAGHMAVTTLLIAGYNPIFTAYQSGNLRSGTPFMRLTAEGVKSACEEHCGGWSIEEMNLEMPTHVNFEKKIARLVDSIPDGAGIVAFTLAYGTHLLKELERQGRAVPEDVGILSIDVVDIHGTKDKCTDLLSFRRERIIARAIELATADKASDVRELVQPTHVRNGTVRVKTNSR